MTDEDEEWEKNRIAAGLGIPLEFLEGQYSVLSKVIHDMEESQRKFGKSLIEELLKKYGPIV